VGKSLQEQMTDAQTNSFYHVLQLGYTFECIVNNVVYMRQYKSIREIDIDGFVCTISETQLERAKNV